MPCRSKILSAGSSSHCVYMACQCRNGAAGTWQSSCISQWIHPFLSLVHFCSVCYFWHLVKCHIVTNCTFSEHIVHSNMFCVCSKRAVRRLTVNLHQWELFSHCMNKEHYSPYNCLWRYSPWNNDTGTACTLLPTCFWCSNQLFKWSDIFPQHLCCCQQDSGCCWQAVVGFGHS